MSKINIGGFDLDLNEIIDVTREEVWYIKFLAKIGMILGYIMLLSVVGSIFAGEFFWKGALLLLILFALMILSIFIYELLKDKLLTFKITVKTMSNGQIKIHTKVFDEDDSSYYYEELKTYI